ncbi:MAG TPA: ATP-binding protein, partial [Puia sp.]|nr:ATP-binding protein [Puia sp.]
TGLPIDDLFYFVQYDSSSGLLFAGTLSKGILIIRKQAVQPVRTMRNDPHAKTTFYNQVGLPGGDILTNDGQILGRNPHPWMPPTLTRPINNFSFLDSDSTLWYSQEDTMRSYSFRTHRMTAAITGAGAIAQGFVRSEDNLCVADAIGAGLLVGEHIDYQFRYSQSNAPDNVPNAMTEISPGLIAIATCKGLLRWNIITHGVDTLLRLPGICVRALWKYKGYLFVGTYGRGIWLYKDGKIRPIPLDKNGYLQYAHCFVPDKLGYCWISTNRGLFRAHPDDMTAAFESPDRIVYYHYYGREDGMTMTELNGGCSPCALMLNDTTLSFPSMDGLIWVDPTRGIPSSPRGRVFIDGFWSDSQRINLAGPGQPILPPDTRDLRIDLAFPAWRSNENLYIAYKLEPWSHDWQTMDLQHGPELQFSNLPYGHYRLMVRNANTFGPPDSPLTVSSFYISPHWFQEPLSWLIGFFLLCALVAGIVRLRTRHFQNRQGRLEKQIAEKTRELQTKNEELERTDLIKTRLISIISHDLITPLYYLHLAGKNLMEKKNDLTEGMQEATIAEMTATSKELELLSTNILNWMKYHNEDRRLAREHFDVHELVAQLFAVLGALARQKGILLVNAIPEGLSLYQYIEPVRIVLYNLILNGLNFTSKGSIRVGTETVHDGILLQISDTGVGMTHEQINHIMADHFLISSANVDNRKGNGLGYMIIKDLLKILRGSLSIRSAKETGTTVTVWITR